MRSSIEYFDSGTLGDEIVHMQQVRTGQLDVIPMALMLCS